MFENPDGALAVGLVDYTPSGHLHALYRRVLQSRRFSSVLNGTAESEVRERQCCLWLRAFSSPLLAFACHDILRGKGVLRHWSTWVTWGAIQAAFVH